MAEVDIGALAQEWHRLPQCDRGKNPVEFMKSHLETFRPYYDDTRRKISGFYEAIQQLGYRGVVNVDEVHRQIGKGLTIEEARDLIIEGMLAGMITTGSGGSDYRPSDEELDGD